MDVTQTWQDFANSPKDFADLLRNRIRQDLGLTISVGVSYNKILAKLVVI